MRSLPDQAACSSPPFPVECLSSCVTAVPAPFSHICHFGFVPVRSSNAITQKRLSTTTYWLDYLVETTLLARRLFIARIRRIFSSRYHGYLRTAGAERVRVGKGPRRIIGKKMKINGARVKMASLSLAILHSLRVAIRWSIFVRCKHRPKWIGCIGVWGAEKVVKAAIPQSCVREAQASTESVCLSWCFLASKLLMFWLWILAKSLNWLEPGNRLKRVLWGWSSDSVGCFWNLLEGI